MHDPVDPFIARWHAAGGTEKANYQIFLTELAQLLDVEPPQPQAADDRDNAYVFERRVTFRHGDGSESNGFIDLYRRGAFVCEAKKIKLGTHTKGFDDAMLRARTQAEQYARALPASEGRPPFLVVVDVGHRIELYAEFSRSGATYTPFPDPSSHRITLDDLRNDAIRERLRRVWLDPMSLDPSREAARVTREIAKQLAELARSLERAGHHAEAVAQFLMRCLFTMFAEDVRLLPEDSFRNLLATHQDKPDVAMRMLAQLWRDMDTGGFCAVLANDVLQFNGKLFKHPDTLPLDRDQIALLQQAAGADWRHVEPAIFGTLLERALNPKERHKLGAHYTPRAYVERLVLPTVIEPLRAEWSNAQAAALTLSAEDKPKEAVAELLRFHHRLCNVRVLDPACGSGNFLYVTLEHLKRLEGEVLNALDELGHRQTGLALDGERADTAAGETVDPHNLLGIELNPRAAAIAEVVLWIGYLQWHFRTRGNVHPPQPVIRDFRNIENRDAVLAYDRVEFVTDERGIPVTRWDGETMKVSPVTGEKIPDDSARKPVERYVNPRKAEWPAADFVVGNPPFIGNKRMRTALGDGYVEALRGAWPDMPESADLVMYWWHHAALLVRRGALQRFGLITTNSIRQAFNRRVIEAALAPTTKSSSAASAKSAAPKTSTTPAPSKPSFRRKPESSSDVHSKDRMQLGERTNLPISIVLAIPDHPWVDISDGAAVRIAMTVAAAGVADGVLSEVVQELETAEETLVTLHNRYGRIFADLAVGADVSAAAKLRANGMISSRGVILHGDGFVISHQQATALGLGRDHNIAKFIRKYRNGRDVTQAPRHMLAIYLRGLSADQVRTRFPELYQWLVDRVKPARSEAKDRQFRELWWLPGRARPELMDMIEASSRFIATVQTSKHRFFTFMEPDVLPDDKLIAIVSDRASALGVLSSEIHGVWALAAGATLEDRPVYNKSTCFECFPFPDADETQESSIGRLAEEIDAHRRVKQSEHGSLTLTAIYNVLDLLRTEANLNPKQRAVHEQGVVGVLRELHDELDAAVLDAYGWSDLLPLLRIAHGNDAPTAGETRDDAKRAFDEAILERLVALNAERAAEEARGHIRWLRPDFQNPAIANAATQTELPADSAADAVDDDTPKPQPLATKPQPWPKDTVDQVRAVADALTASPTPLTLDDLAARFTARGPWKKRLPQLLDMLVVLGRARESGGQYIAS